MSTEPSLERRGCTPVEVLSVLRPELDYDTAVRCLAFIRHHRHRLMPQLPVMELGLLALSHHTPCNVYPAFGVFSSSSECIDPDWLTDQIDLWIQSISLPVLIERSASFPAPSWDELKAQGYVL